MSKHTSTLVNPEDTVLTYETGAVLEHVANMLPQLIHWLVKSGIGYHEFAPTLKTLFYNAALQELSDIQQKKTDSAISLLSGLTRRDIRNFCQTYGEYTVIDQFNSQLPISVPIRVVSMWINQKLPMKIPFYGQENSFESLVKQLSSDKHPKSILWELKRLGIVQEENDDVILEKSSFIPNPELDESKQLFTQNIADHLSAGISNLTKKTDFLEQAVFADELSQESVQKLNQLSTDLWRMMSKAIISAAIDYCKNDEKSGDTSKRFRLGIYQYYE